MQTYIALFRGINIGGHNIVPMSELVAILERLGMNDINSYMQENELFVGKDSKDL